MEKDDVQIYFPPTSSNFANIYVRKTNPVPLQRSEKLVKLWKIPRKGILSLIGCFIAQMTYGSFFSFGNIITYVTSYMRRTVYTELTYAHMIMVPSVTLVGIGIIMPITGVLGKWIEQKKIIMIGSMMMSGSVFLSYFTVTHSLWLFTLTYGFFFGLGIGCAYVPPLTICMKWFPGRKGLVSGIVVGGFGAGTFIFSQVQTAYLNPENVRVDNETRYIQDMSVLSAVPNMFLLLGGIFITLQVTGILLISERQVTNKEGLSISSLKKEEQSKEEHLNHETTVLEAFENATGQEDDDHKTQPVLSQSVVTGDVAVKEENTDASLKPQDVLRRREFYILWFSFCCIQLVIGFTCTMFKAYGQEFISDDHFLTMVGAVAAIFNAIGRVVWGVIMDSTSYRTSMLILCTILATLLFTVTQTPVGGKIMYACWIWAIYLSFSGIFTLVPVATDQVFGSTHYGANYGMIYTHTIVSGILFVLFTSILQQRIGYFGMFLGLGGIAVFVMLLTLMFPRQPSPEVTKKITCWNLRSRCR